MSERAVTGKLSAYRRSCRQGTDWLLNLVNPDGSIGPARSRLCYYRVPWTFALVGEIVAANRSLDWISRHMFTAEGAFEGVSPLGIFESRYGSYPVACLIVGATLLERFDISRRGAEHLKTWQDPQSGGFYNSLGGQPDASEQEIFPASQGGMTFLMVGMLDEARKAGVWLRRLWELQPDVAHKLYHVYSPGKGLVEDFPPDQQALYVTLKDDPLQHHFNGGIAAAFLTKLYLATAESEWLDLARKYQEFSMTTDECQFESMQVCKSGWGSGLLYVVTREEAYRRWTLRLGDWFVGLQKEDGHWENTKMLNPNPTVADNIEITAEFVMHVANIMAYLAV